MDDVDALALEFVDDVLDADAADADAGADGVEPFLAAVDGDFGAVAGFAGDGFDFDEAFEDFGDFKFEDALDEGFVGAGDDDLGAFVVAEDFDDVDEESLAGAVVLHADLFGGGEDSFGAAEVKDDLARFDALDDGGDGVAFLAGVLVEDGFALGFAEAR